MAQVSDLMRDTKRVKVEIIYGKHLELIRQIVVNIPGVEDNGPWKWIRSELAVPEAFKKEGKVALGTRVCISSTESQKIEIDGENLILRIPAWPRHRDPDLVALFFEKKIPEKFILYPYGMPAHSGNYKVRSLDFARNIILKLIEEGYELNELHIVSGESGSQPEIIGRRNFGNATFQLSFLWDTDEQHEHLLPIITLCKDYPFVLNDEVKSPTT